MITLEKIKARAQQDANRDNKSLMILNLNRFSPMYVIRSYSERHEKEDKQFICRIDPVIPDSWIEDCANMTPMSPD